MGESPTTPASGGSVPASGSPGPGSGGFPSEQELAKLPLDAFYEEAEARERLGALTPEQLAAKAASDQLGRRTVGDKKFFLRALVDGLAAELAKQATPAPVAVSEVPSVPTPPTVAPAPKEFYSSSEAMKKLSIDEARLKSLVNEGEIRAFREGDGMKFRCRDVDNLDLDAIEERERELEEELLRSSFVPICEVSMQTDLSVDRIKELVTLGHLGVVSIDGVLSFTPEQVKLLGELDKKYPPKEPVKPTTPPATPAEPPVPPKPPVTPEDKGRGCEHEVELLGGEPTIRSNCRCGTCRPVQQVVIMPTREIREVVTAPLATAPTPEPRRRLPWWAWILIAGIAIPAIAWVWTKLADKAAGKETGMISAPAKELIDTAAREKADKANERIAKLEESVKNAPAPLMVDQVARTAAGEAKELAKAADNKATEGLSRTATLSNQVAATATALAANKTADDEIVRRTADLERRMPRQGPEPKNGPAPVVKDPPKEPVKPASAEWTPREREIAGWLYSAVVRGERAAREGNQSGLAFEQDVEAGWQQLWRVESKKPLPTHDELIREFGPK